MGNLIRYHIVKLGVLGMTLGVGIYDMVTKNISHSTYLMFMLAVYQVRGIFWEEGYRKELERLKKQ